MLRLSDAQREIAESDAKHILVVAGAGCGKTTTLVSYVMDRARKGEKQVVLTFSNKAAEDVRAKVESVMPDYEDLMYIGTVHSFCRDMISRYGANVGVDPDVQIFESEADRKELFVQAMASIPETLSALNQIRDEKDRKRVIDERFMQMTIDKKRMSYRSDENRMLFKEYDDLLASMNAIDFDDMVILARRILLENSAVSRIYRVYYSGICIDEAQDMDMPQYEFVKALAGDRMRIFMVGDPGQAIYGFSGASSEYMCESFPSDYPDTVVKRLTDNYRSSKQVIRAARIIDRKFSPRENIPIEGEFSIHAYDDPEAQAGVVVADIIRLLDEGHADLELPLKRESVCVLARNKSCLGPVAEALDMHGIGYTVKASYKGPEFRSQFFEEMWLGLRMILNPADTYHLARLNRMMGLPEDTPFGSITAIGASEELPFLAQVWSEMAAQERGGRFEPDMITGIMAGYIESMGGDEAEAASDDLEVWKDIVRLYISGSRLGERSLSGMMAAHALGKTRSLVESGVILSTVHMAKGLEYDVVYVIDVNEGDFPDYRSRSPDKLEEERHNFFVAVTRAKRICHVSYVREKMIGGRMRPKQRSRFLDPLIDEFGQVQETDSSGE